LPVYGDPAAVSVAATAGSIVAVIAVGVLPPVTARSSQLPPEFVLGVTDAVVPLGKVTVTVCAGGVLDPITYAKLSEVGFTPTGLTFTATATLTLFCPWIVTVRELLLLLAMGSVDTVTCAGVVSCVVGETCSQDALDATRKFSAAPVLAKLRVAEAPTLGCAVIVRGLGVITSPCADSAAAVINSNESCLKRKPPTGMQSGAGDAPA
jgi:hypothetical protein